MKGVSLSPGHSVPVRPFLIVLKKAYTFSSSQAPNADLNSIL